MKYSHPDYSHYGIQPWQLVTVSGTKLNHHVDNANSSTIIQLGSVIGGAAIGAMFSKGPVGAAVGAALGVALTGVLMIELMDETNCNRIRIGKGISLKWIGGLALVPKYYRIGQITLRDECGAGNPL